jgi:hypothetical protein
MISGLYAGFGGIAATSADLTPGAMDMRRNRMKSLF